MLFTGSELSEYLNFLSSKEGFMEDTTRYLSNKMNLLEKATLHLNEVLPIYPIVMLVYEDTFLNGQSIDDKINFLKKCFETLFIYSKNLLTKFSFYFDKPVKEAFFQDIKYLSQFSNHHNYTGLIGYVFQPYTSEWKFMENTLSPERETNLQCLTMWCSVGYDYWINLPRYLNLTVFTSHRLSIEKLLKENKCDYCDFDLSPNQYLCTVCNSEINKMIFFDKWQLNLTKASSLESINENIEPKSTFRSLDITTHRKTVENLICEHSTDKVCDHCAFIVNKNNLKPNTYSNNEETKTDGWTCECTYINKRSSLNCQVCFKENINALEINRNHPLSDGSTSKISEAVISDQSHKNEPIPKQMDDGEWECTKCTARNSNKSWFCEACLNENKNSRNLFSEYKPMEINDFAANKYFEQSQPTNLVHSYYSDKNQSKMDKSNEFPLVDLSMRGSTEFNPIDFKETTHIINPPKNEPGCMERIYNKLLTCVLSLFSHLLSTTSTCK